MSQCLYRSICVLMLMTCMYMSSYAKEYHVAKGGNDASLGTLQSPFASIQKAASVMKAGDVCLISEGNYYETVIPAHSGRAGRPIIYKAARPNDKVILTGSKPIPRSLWKKDGKNRFKCRVTLPLKDGNQIFLKGKSLVEARWPNLGDDYLKPKLAIMDDGTHAEKIIDQQLPKYDYRGARVWVHARYYWKNWTSEILNHSGSSLNIKNKAPFSGANQHNARKGAEYYVYNLKDALDSENEWFYDSKEKMLWVYRHDGKLPKEAYRIKATTHVLDVSGKKHLKFQGLTILGSSLQTNPQTTSVVFDRMKILYPHYSANGGKGAGRVVTLNGKNNTIQNSEIAYSWGPCIALEGENNKLLNSYIHDGNLFGAFTGCVYLSGKGNVVSHCTIERSGRTLINYSGMYQALIQNCILRYAGMLTSDLGLTYGTNIEGGNSEVRFNLMHGNLSKHKNMGLYYDHGTKNVITHHNIIWGARQAGLIINHYANGHLIYNNTFIADNFGFKSTWGHKYEPDLLNCRFVNNLMAGIIDTTAKNLYAQNNVTNFKSFDPKNPMRGYVKGYGKGVMVKGVTSAKPGIGAIEYKGMTFKAGHDFQIIPVYDFVRSKPLHRNHIVNAAFEHQDHISPWQFKGKGVSSVKHKPQYHNLEDVNLGRMGCYSVALTKPKGELTQRIKGLEEGSKYDFICMMRVPEGSVALSGVRFSNGSERLSQKVSSGAPGWVRNTVAFTAPLDKNPVEVFVRLISGAKAIHVDDFSLTMNSNN
ncbi:MAG: right-handed parallel beta-helix repeat-containing protein [Planctomycetes bacterium]|nr:right-handed parallel beta-helix repeat-containing protein [Planctomycetota bacterium]